MLRLELPGFPGSVSEVWVAERCDVIRSRSRSFFGTALPFAAVPVAFTPPGSQKF